MSKTTVFLKRYRLAKPITRQELLKRGANIISEVMCEDRYFLESGGTTLAYTKLRKEGNIEERTITSKQIAIGKEKIIKETANSWVFSRKESKPHKEVAHVHKKRTTAIIDSVVIQIDKISGFGEFIEFGVMEEKDIQEIDKVSKLFSGFIEQPALTSSYLDIFLKSQTKFTIWLHKLFEILGNLAFGISGSVLTTLGIMVGLLSATSSELAVIAGIVSVAIADSLSDSISMFSAKKAESGTSHKIAIASALNVFIGKLVFTLSFIVPFLLFSFQTAIIISIIWGLFLIILVNLAIAMAQEESKFKTIMKNTFLALLVVVVSYLFGLLVNLVFMP